MKKFAFSFILFLFAGILMAGNLQEAKALFNKKDFAAAEKIFEKIIEENDTSAVANYYLARIKYIQKEYDDATDFAERAVELNPDIADYHFWYANALGAKTQRSNVFTQAWLAPKILKQYKRTVALDSLHIGGHIGAGNFYLMAPGIMGGDIDKAREEAQTVIRLGSDRGRLLLAAIYQKDADFVNAEKQYDILEKTFNDSTGSPGFYNNYGYFLIGRKNTDKAIKMFRRLVQLRSGEANSYDSLGDGFRAAGELDSARVAYKHALRIDPNFKPSKEKLKKLSIK